LVRFFPKFRGRGLQHNIVSWVGGLIMLVAVVLLGAFLVIVLAIPNVSPYLGIASYLVTPGIFFFGLIIFLAGMWRESRRRLRGEVGGLAYPVIDLNKTGQRHRAQMAVVVILLVSLLVGFAAYEGYAFTGSVTFCGEVCHTVMEPEYTAYQGSPHANILCAECHVGPGASWYVRSKLSGVRQVFAVLLNTYPRPIRVPISELRPARQVCEECHWPNEFVGSILKRIPDFYFTEANTASQVFFALHVGGGRDLAEAGGIHWHVSEGVEVSYTATDELLQEIPYVEVRYPDGEERAYSDPSYDFSDEERAELPTRVMDCMDCHNRPTHIIGSPDQELDDAMARGEIPADLPSIKTIGFEALTQEWPTEEEAAEGIPASVRSFYQDNHPNVLAEREEEVDQAIERILEIWQTSIFPEMNVTWDIYPVNVGHKDWPGCFRCHNGEHVSEDGEVISRACDLCHTPPQRSALRPLEGPNLLSGFSNWHPFELEGRHEEILCSACHDSGEREPSRCIDCHELDPAAPHMSTLDCGACHTQSALIQPVRECRECHPSPANWHRVAGHAELGCTRCHEPHEWDPPRRDLCLGCHPQMAGPEGLSTYLAAFHQPGAVCRSCHIFRPGPGGVPLPNAQ